MTDEKRFAYGETNGLEASCPAYVAGRNPDRNPRVERIATTYDQVVAQKLSDGAGDDDRELGPGVITEEFAKECWLEAIERVERNEFIARNIAHQLGWL